MTKLNQFAIAHKPIFWDVSQETLTHMDESSIVERFFCYGNWEEYKQIELLIGKSRAKEIFIQRAYNPRTNLRNETINLFTHYFHAKPPKNHTLSRAM